MPRNNPNPKRQIYARISEEDYQAIQALRKAYPVENDRCPRRDSTTAEMFHMAVRLFIKRERNRR